MQLEQITMKRVEVIEDERIFNTSENPSLAADFFQMPAAEISEQPWLAILQRLEIYPTVGHLNSHSLKTNEGGYRHHQVMQLAAEHALPIRFLGYAPIIDKTRVFAGIETDWVMTNLESDPLYLAGGKRLMAPRAVKAELSRIVAAGLDWDAYFIAHEIPTGSMQSGQDIPPELVIPPEHHQSVQRVQKYASRVTQMWTALTEGTLKVAEIGMGAVAMAASPLLLLDPVLFGVQVEKEWRIEGYPVGRFYSLVSWNWKTEEAGK